MADCGLVLIGSRPPSRLDSRPPSSTSTSYNDSPIVTKPSKYNAYADELFGTANTDSARSKSIITNKTYKQSTVNINTGKYGSNLMNATQTIYNNTRPVKSNGTNEFRDNDVVLDVTGKRSTMGRPPSGQRANYLTKSVHNSKVSATPVRKVYHKLIHTPSYVDETLFGPRLDEATFSAPWDSMTKKQRAFVFDCTDYQQKTSDSRPSSALSVEPQSRPGSRLAASSRPASAVSSNLKAKSFRGRCSTPTYVDEALFGQKLNEPSWRAPWDKETTTGKPLLFDATDHRVNIQHSNMGAAVKECRRTSNFRARSNSTGSLVARPAFR